MRRVLLVLSCIAVAGALVGCGVSGTVDPVAAAATKSSNAGGVKFTMSATILGDDMGLTMNGHGAFAGSQGEMEIDVSGAPSGESTMKEIMVTEAGDPVMYLSLPFLTSQLPGGKTWLRIDLQEAGKALGLDFNKLLGGTQSPTQTFELLKASSTFYNAGTELIDGVQTTHYAGTLDLSENLKASGATAAAVQQLIDAGAPSKIPFEVWIDDENLIRQIREGFNQTENGTTPSFAMTMNLSDYGSNVEVSAPPADEVFDATDLATQSLQSLKGTTA